MAGPCWTHIPCRHASGPLSGPGMGKVSAPGFRDSDWFVEKRCDVLTNTAGETWRNMEKHGETGDLNESQKKHPNLGQVSRLTKQDSSMPDISAWGAAWRQLVPKRSKKCLQEAPRLQNRFHRDLGWLTGHKMSQVYRVYYRILFGFQKTIRTSFWSPVGNCRDRKRYRFLPGIEPKLWFQL